MQVMQTLIRRWARVLIAALCIACIPACNKQPQQSTKPAPAPSPAATPSPSGPPRVVVLSPALAITLKDLGLEHMIVGRHGYDMVLDKSLPVCGDQAGIDYEALIRAKPTHVVLQWGARPLPDRLNELATTYHWIIVNQELLTLSDVRSSTVELFDILAGPENQRSEDSPPGRRPKQPDSPELVNSPAPALLDRMERAFAKRGAGFPSAGRVLLLLSASPTVAAVGPGSFHVQVLEAIGGTSALKKGGPYQEMDTEDVVNLAPDAIIILRPRGIGTDPQTYTQAEITSMLGTLAGKPIPAVSKNCVAVIDDPLCLMPGTSLVEFADRLADVLKAWQ
jgi:ABC-type Fe3+-hydroxamate transport system substrate-binding protein